MSEQETPANEQDTSEDAPIAASTETPAIDWSKRYNDLRSEFDKRNSPEARQNLFNELAQEYGYELDQGETQETYEDPYEQLAARVAAQEQQFQQYTQQQSQQRQVQIAEAYADSRLDQLNVSDQRKRDWIISRANSMPALQHEGHVVPDIEAAHLEYQELVNSEKQAWAQTKQAPHVASAGQENTGVPAWSDDPRERAVQRQAWQLEQFQLGQQ